MVGDGIDQTCDGQDATFQMDGTQLTNCYLQGTDTAYCWGNPLNGEILGEGSYIYVKTGHNTTCALTTDSEIACFGSEHSITPPEGVFKQMDISEYNGCALDENGQITCWGTGQGDVFNIPDGTFIRISKGWEHQCAIDILGKFNVGVTCLLPSKMRMSNISILYRVLIIVVHWICQEIFCVGETIFLEKHRLQ